MWWFSASTCVFPIHLSIFKPSQSASPRLEVVALAVSLLESGAEAAKLPLVLNAKSNHSSRLVVLKHSLFFSYCPSFSWDDWTRQMICSNGFNPLISKSCDTAQWRYSTTVSPSKHNERAVVLCWKLFLFRLVWVLLAAWWSQCPDWDRCLLTMPFLMVPSCEVLAEFVC